MCDVCVHVMCVLLFLRAPPVSTAPRLALLKASLPVCCFCRVYTPTILPFPFPNDFPREIFPRFPTCPNGFPREMFPLFPSCTRHNAQWQSPAASFSPNFNNCSPLCCLLTHHHSAQKKKKKKKMSSLLPVHKSSLLPVPSVASISSSRICPRGPSL